MSEIKKGVVLETSSGTVTVLTPQGEFLSIPWAHSNYPAIGSEIEVNITPQRSLFRQSYFLALAASLLLFFISIPLWRTIIMPGAGHIVAYVSVDINPSIELGLNQQGLVLSAAGLNEDGVMLLEKLDLIKLTFDKAVELITNQAVKEQYITSDKENTVIITVSGGDKLPEQVRKLDNSVKKILEEKELTGSAQVLEVPDDFRDKARNLGISQGKYVIYMEAVEQGLDLSLEDLKKDNIVKALQEAGGIPGQIISKAQHDRNELKEIEKRIEENTKKIEENKKKIKEQKGKTGLPQQEEVPDLKPRDGAGQNNSGEKSANTNAITEDKQGDIPPKGEPPLNSGNNEKDAEEDRSKQDKKEDEKNQQDLKKQNKNKHLNIKTGFSRQQPGFLFSQLPGYLKSDIFGVKK